MSIDGIVGIVGTTRLTMTEDELNACVRLLNAEIKHRRDTNIKRVKNSIRQGDVVSFLNNDGNRVRGEVTRVKTKKALVKVGNTSWDVPMGMLSICR